MGCGDCSNLLSIPVFSTYSSCTNIPNVGVTFSTPTSGCFSTLSINTSLGLTVDELFEYLTRSQHALEELTSLTVTHADLSGEFPDILPEPQLAKLTTLDISYNSITGHLPTLRGSSIRIFFANENLFFGKVPNSYVSHNFTYNCLKGQLPPSANFDLFEYQNGLLGALTNPNPDCNYEPEGYAVAGTSSSSSTTTTTTAAAATPTLSSLNGCVVQQQIYVNNPNNTLLYKNLVNPCPANNTYMFWAYQAVTATSTSSSTKTTSTKKITTTSSSSSKTTAKSSSSTTSVKNIRLRRRDRLGRRRVFAKRDTSTEFPTDNHPVICRLGPQGTDSAANGQPGVADILGLERKLLHRNVAFDIQQSRKLAYLVSALRQHVSLFAEITAAPRNVANSGITDALPAALQAIITANGGTVNWGTACNPQNPNAVCPKPAIPPVDCYALSRDSTFVDPMYDGAWKDWSHSAGEASLEGTLDYRPNPEIGEFYYAQFVQYVHSLRYCQKKHPEYKYWTYARVHPPGKPVAIPINEESQQYGAGQPYLQGIVPAVLGS
ncbi:hypothetical protein HDU83_004195 [Entophlyctis luteolus]|nr:hypothetical protein HDU83_004195 [Entophlyctis luteolus]